MGGSTAARARQCASRWPVAPSFPCPARGTLTRWRGRCWPCDVMSTGHHRHRVARVMQGDTVSVVGDGAVGLCGILASKRLGADRIIGLSRHTDHQKVAREFGATDTRMLRHRAIHCYRGGDRPTRLDHRHRRGPAWPGALRRGLLPQHRLARRPCPRPGSKFPNCSATSSTARSTPAGLRLRD